MVSVIIPAYNAEQYVEQSMRSILDQTYKDLELIVVLDCPTDNTESLVEAIASADDRVKVLKNEENLGAGKTRQKGIAEAKGEYIMLQDADDYYALDYIETLVKMAEESGAEIVSGGITTIKEDGSYIAEGQPSVVLEGYDRLYKHWNDGKIVWMCNKLIAKRLYDLVPYVGRRYVEDTPTIIPMMWHANKLAVVDHVGYYHRMVSTSICHTINRLDDAIYKTLCWCDLVDFFLEHDTTILKETNMLTQVVQNIEWLNELDATAEEMKPYEHDYCEVMRRLLHYVKINGIDFKNINLQ